MPINEALFWFGIATFETGLYFVFSERPVAGIALMACGVIGCVYSVYAHHKPELKKPPLWVVLLIVTWATLGYDMYDRHRALSPVHQAAPGWVYLLMVALLLAAVMFMYVQGHATTFPKRTGADQKGIPAKIEILSYANGSHVGWREEFSGSVEPSGTVQVFVTRPGANRFWKQWAAKVSNTHWKTQCQFGDEHKEGNLGEYDVIAVAGGQILEGGKPYASLPEGGIPSAPVRVLRTK